MNIRRVSALVPVIAVLAVLFGGAAAWAVPACPLASPNFTPDFSSNTGLCLTLNGLPSAPSVSGYPGFYPPASSLTQPPETPNPAGPAPSGVNTVLRLTTDSTFTSGSAWFNTQQPVAGPFSSTFQFQLSGSTTSTPADGFAFVIQNQPTTPTNALDPNSGSDGCSMGFGDAPVEGETCTSATGGITNSLAIGFDTYQNPDIGDVSNSHVEIQSCGMGANSVDSSCRIADVDLTQLAPPINLADGNVHTVAITATSSALANCGETAVTCSRIDVIIDSVDLFPVSDALPNGVVFDFTTIGLTTTDSCTNCAYVGFTAATGGSDDNQDILDWNYTPQSQTQVVSTTSPTTFSFNNNAYNYFAQLNTGTPTTLTVAPIFMIPSACDALVQATYPTAHCFVYTNLGPGVLDSAVLFNITCPSLPSDACTPFSAELGTNYALSNTQTGAFNPVDPYPGWLKGNGGVTGDPCALQQVPNPPPLFQSNQVDAFSLTSEDPGTKGGSGGTGSCWVATYDQPDEKLSVITIASPTNTSYAQNASVAASYTCATPTSTKSEFIAPTSPVGPYLTVASCVQSSGTQGSCTTTAAGQSCTGTVNTSTLGMQTFTVTAMDTGTNTSTNFVNYNVVAATNLQIVNVGTPGTAATGSQISYNIGVADLGPVNAVGVMVTDALPSNTSFVSASGSNVSCSIVNKKLVCTATPVSCSGGPTVTCNVGTLAPLSISSLNGAAMKITVKVTGQPGTNCKVGSAQKPCTIDTATVSADNTDTNPHPSSTVQTIY